VEYPIVGLVHPRLINRFPQKYTIGDDSFANEEYLSNWITSHHKNGILIEEMDERNPQHQGRAYWSNAILGFDGHLTLPRLVTQLTDLANPTIPTITNADFEHASSGWTEGAGTWAQSGTQKHGGTYSWKNDNGVAADNIYQDMASYTPGRAYTFTLWVYTQTGAETLKLGINDGVTTTYGSTVAGTTWVQATFTKTLAVAATRLRLIAEVAVAQAGADFYVDDADISQAAISLGTTRQCIMYNSIAYFSFGANLCKENAAGDGFDLVAVMPAAITGLVVSEGNHLYIYFGDATNYVYMTTAEAFVQADVLNFTHGIHWDNKLFKLDSLGATTYSTDPSAASPTWAACGDLADEGLADNDVTGLSIYRNASGNPIIYAQTKVGLFAYSWDSGTPANSYWTETELALPNHPTCGKGGVWWRGDFYISAGLDVIKYKAAATSSTESVGLSKDDGLPSEYRGEITKFIQGYNEFFALVDASLVTGTGYSGLYAYDGLGWQCWWTGATADDVMSTGMVGADYGYRLYFDHDAKFYYIDLQRDIRNPKKLSTFAYGTAGLHLDPWFDGGTAAYPKLAKRVQFYCNGMSATEKITPYYRIDHSTTTVPVANWTGWTKLTSTTYADGITADGVAEFEFGTNGVGIAFKAIQFGYDLERTNATPATDKLKSPDMKAMVFSYMKLLDLRWDFSCKAVCETAAKRASLIAAAESQTLIEFTFMNDSTGGETHYVKVLPPLVGASSTGSNYPVTFDLLMLEP